LLLVLNIGAVLLLIAATAWRHYAHTIHRIVPDPAALESRESVEYCRRMQAALAAGQFDRLESEARSAPKDRLPGAAEKISVFYGALANPGCDGFDCKADYLPRIRQLQDWLNRNPRQPSARIAMAFAWWNHAWRARDCAEFHDVTFEHWQAFFDRMRVAHAYLAGIEVTDDPEYWRLSLDFLRDSGAGRPEIDAMFFRGHEAFPRYFTLVEDYANILDPHWYGKEGDLGWLAEAVLNDPGGEDGLMEYALVAQSEALRIDYPHLFLETGLTWQRVKAGLALIEQRYGATNYDWNLRCYMAMVAIDRPAAQDAYRHFAPQWNPVVWRSADYFYDQALPWITWGQ
jgi:hypothetical protein